MTDLKGASVYQGTVYQTATIPGNVLEKLIVDDSPGIFMNKFWEFLGVDIRIADIKPWDFDNVLDMVDVAFVNILMEFPETEWNKVVMVEYKRIAVIDPNNPKNVLGFKMEPSRAYHISKLWDAMRAKIYLKMCGAREGFDFKQITENRSMSEMKGYPTASPVMPQGQPMPQKQGSRWKI